ncbi:hypothetical protein LCGC14_1131360 [marine sediment metagenome]|uniref:Lipoprotein n=1 Tax=marine sediment metagenome TaxID=412755 RepID=A0A0F9Q6S0_9ZZZZ
MKTTRFLILGILACLVVGCPMQPQNQAREACRGWLDDDTSFNSTIILYEEIRDLGASKAEVILGTGTMCEEGCYRVHACVRSCLNCALASIDFVWP